jgi:hypothetical protein
MGLRFATQCRRARSAMPMRSTNGAMKFRIVGPRFPDSAKSEEFGADIRSMNLQYSDPACRTAKAALDPVRSNPNEGYASPWRLLRRCNHAKHFAPHINSGTDVGAARSTRSRRPDRDANPRGQHLGLARPPTGHGADPTKRGSSRYRADTVPKRCKLRHSRSALSRTAASLA